VLPVPRAHRPLGGGAGGLSGFVKMENCAKTDALTTSNLTSLTLHDRKCCTAKRLGRLLSILARPIAKSPTAI
jgi:hypothetical protein